MNKSNGAKNRKGAGKYFPISETVSISLKIEIDRFLSDENQTELVFPTFLSAQERGFIHQAASTLGLKSKSRGKGANRYITLYKKTGSTIIQDDSKLILDAATRTSIGELLSAHPISIKEKDDLNGNNNVTILRGTMGLGLGAVASPGGVAQVPPAPHPPTEVLRSRQALPVWEQRAALLAAIDRNQVVVVAGATGSGKSTLLPQLILEQCTERRTPARIFCTQPRRIAALTLAERVAWERGERLGQIVGYQIRLESRVSPRTVLTYCTCGVLTRMLMHHEQTLATATHVFVDEVHERDKFCDFLLIGLREVLARHKELKVVVMSATVDSGALSRYLGNCPVLRVTGRQHAVTRLYLDEVLRLTGYKLPQPAEEKPSSSEPGATAEPSAYANQAADPELQQDMDRFLEECFEEGTVESFSQILYMILSEGGGVDCAHSSSGRTALMAAARHGHDDTAKQLLRLGAARDLTDCAGLTARDYAVQHGHAATAQLLADADGAASPAGPASPASPASPLSPAAASAPVPAPAPLDPETERMLDAYQRTVREDQVDLDLMAAVIAYVHTTTVGRGALLAFLPGYEELAALQDRLHNCPRMRAQPFNTYLLHSNMHIHDQKKAFAPSPHARKIIIATNIAESSVTIDDVVYVVDGCRVKEMYYSEGVHSLRCVWASRACLEQRAGRAGRTQPGHAFHMCSRRRAASLPPHPPPEMLRAPLHELCLHAKLLAPHTTPIADFLARAPDPPPFLAVRAAVTLLKTIGALTFVEELTELGRLLLELPVDPRLGKMLVYGALLKCLDPVLTIVCALAGKEPFRIAPNTQARRIAVQARHEFAAEAFSDHLVVLRAFQAWQAARAHGHERAFCARTLVCAPTMEMIAQERAKLLAQLRAMALVKARGPGDIKDVNAYSERWPLVKAVLAAGLYPSVARLDREVGVLRTAQESRVTPHPSSVLGKDVTKLPGEWVIFEEVSRVGRVCWVRRASVVSALALALCAGPLRLPAACLQQRANPAGLSSDSDSEEDAEAEAAGEAGESRGSGATLALDEWARWGGEATDCLAVFLLRQKLSAMLVRRMSAPGRAGAPADDAVLACVAGALAAEERRAHLPPAPPGLGARPKPLTVPFVHPHHANIPTLSSHNH